jgi:hypothetical protein
MLYDRMVLLSYVIQGSHAFLSAMHAWFLLEGSLPVLNTIMVAVNAIAFIHAANWRASLRAHAKRMQRNRDLFRR